MLTRIISSILALACIALAIALVWPGRSAAPAPLPEGNGPVAGPGKVDEERALVDRSVGDLNFDQAALNDVIETLSQRVRVTLYVRWHALEGAGIDRAAPVTLHLRNASLRQALNLLEDQVGAGVARLSHVAADGVVTISTVDDQARMATTEIYDIRELLDDLMTAQAAQVARTGGRGAVPLTYGEAVEFVIKLITEAVVFDTWHGAEGIRELGGFLFVTHLPGAQLEVRELLARIRAAIHRHEPWPTTKPAAVK